MWRKRSWKKGALCFAACLLPGLTVTVQAQELPGLRKVKDLLIYEDSTFYSAFPSVEKTSQGFLLAFRRAPDRRIFGEKGTAHVDPNSYLVQMRSSDGEIWSGTPELLYAHPFGGSQDPCLLQLRNGTLLCASYGWAFVNAEGREKLPQPRTGAGNALFLGGYLLRSKNAGRDWEGPFYPPSIPPEKRYNALGSPLPAYNRGAMYEGKDGTVYWAVAAADSSGRTSVHLLSSADEGLSWQYRSVIAEDDKISFNEASLYQTPEGDILAFLRTEGFGDEACVARSTDGGNSFGPWEKMGFRGHPFHALPLRGGQVLLSYGYRHQPYGIRARLLDAECTTFNTPELILREDGGNPDLGYPWAVQLDKRRVLVVYYFNKAGGTRHIAGSVLEIVRE